MKSFGSYLWEIPSSTVIQLTCSDGFLWYGKAEHLKNFTTCDIIPSRYYLMKVVKVKREPAYNFTTIYIERG